MVKDDKGKIFDDRRKKADRRINNEKPQDERRKVERRKNKK